MGARPGDDSRSRLELCSTARPGDESAGARAVLCRHIRAMSSKVADITSQFQRFTFVSYRQSVSPSTPSICLSAPSMMT